MPSLRPNITVLTAATSEPVTLEEARQWSLLDADDTSQDWKLLMISKAARERAEFLTGMALLRQTLEWRINRLPTDDNPLEIPYPPLVTLNYISYIDSTGVAQTLAGSPDAWLLNAEAMPARVTPLYGEPWPDVREQTGAVRIGFTCGYATSSQMPAQLLLWMQQRIESWFCAPGAMAPRAVHEMPRDHVDALLDPFRFDRFFV